MKHVLITGGLGFIGTNLANYYLQKGCRVVVYDTLGRNGCIENLNWLHQQNNAEQLVVLIGDVRLPTREFQEELENSDVVFHMAAQVAVTTSVIDPVHDFEVNALGTFKILELVRNSTRKKPVVFFCLYEQSLRWDGRYRYSRRGREIFLFGFS